MVKMSPELEPDREKEEEVSPNRSQIQTFIAYLLTDPPLLFCDEPTTGLDSYSAGVVIDKLRQFAASGKVVVCTIHQPASGLFDMFNQVLLVARGRVAFYVSGTGLGTEFGVIFLSVRRSMQSFLDGVHLVGPPPPIQSTLIPPINTGDRQVETGIDRDLKTVNYYMRSLTLLILMTCACLAARQVETRIIIGDDSHLMLDWWFVKSRLVSCDRCEALRVGIGNQQVLRK
uniref:Protein white n=1 Tax=Timema genevievae TaxID=629358 RepID=A0A7R9K0H6_TIMGE|nr:unnamed protein product [Timema genevievae]